MTLHAAIKNRIMDLCEQQNITVNRLCILSDVPSDTLSQYFEGNHQDIRFSTVCRLCEGFGISLADFFCCDTFRNLESE